jgi:hypothetical protein
LPQAQHKKSISAAIPNAKKQHIMSEWKTYKLGEIYNFSSGLSKGKEFFGQGYDFVTFKDVFQNYFLPDNLTSLYSHEF